MAPGQEASLAPPSSKVGYFGSKMYCIEENTCDIVGTFRRPGNRAPLVTPLYSGHMSALMFCAFLLRNSQ